MRSNKGIFWSTLAVGFSGAMIPGPMLALVLSLSVKGRFWGSMGVVLGHVLLEAALVLALALGAGKLLRLPLVSAVVGLVGGALLCYMGGSVLLALAHNAGALAASADAGIATAPVLAGVVVSASNPSFTMWWSAVGVGYVAMSLQRGPLGLASFYVGHTLSDWVWYALVAGLVVSGRNVLAGRAYTWVIGGCAFLLAGFGLYFVYLGARQLAQALFPRPGVEARA
jgi:threonine/homoserine/homoserine lactone efflux protein